jgi:hypothetical protein
MNMVWVVIPIYLMYESYLSISTSLRVASPTVRIKPTVRVPISPTKVPLPPSPKVTGIKGTDEAISTLSGASGTEGEDNVAARVRSRRRKGAVTPAPLSKGKTK